MYVYIETVTNNYENCSLEPWIDWNKNKKVFFLNSKQ